MGKVYVGKLKSGKLSYTYSRKLAEKHLRERLSVVGFNVSVFGSKARPLSEVLKNC